MIATMHELDDLEIESVSGGLKFHAGDALQAVSGGLGGSLMQIGGHMVLLATGCDCGN